MAGLIISRPKPTSPSPRISWAKSTITASPAMAHMFINESKIARSRNNRLRHSQRTPSEISERMVGLGADSGVALGGARNRPGIEATSTATARKEAASSQNGAAAAAATRSPPSGGPTN